MSQRYYQRRVESRSTHSSLYSSRNNNIQRATEERFRRPVAILAVLIVGAIVFNLFFHAHRTTAVSSTSHYSKLQTVCLDPGHGGNDPGATMSSGNTTERDINLTVALHVRQILENRGYKVYMTRTTDAVTLSNRDRYTYCNNQRATIMVAVHHNFFDDTSVDYTTTLFYKDSDQALASDIVNSVSSKLHTKNDNIAQFDDGVLSESTMPAALSEGFFITNTSEVMLLSASGSSRLLDEATGIANGIITYFTTPKKSQPAATVDPQVIERE